MRQWQRLVGGFGLLACGAAGCGQDLVLPTQGQAKPDGGTGPVDGITGSSGAAADARPGKLPGLDTPMFTPFGGAGGEASASDAEPSRTSRGGSAGRGGAAATGGRGGTSPAGEAGSGGSGAPPPAKARLLFSEYVEGAGKFKALELLALEGGSLEGCELQTYFNGNQDPSRLALHGELAQGELQVLCSPTLALEHSSLCSSINLTFNGNDALALACEGVLQDIFGQIGVNPGESWGAGATLDHTLQRRCSVTAGRTDNLQPFDLDGEWLVATDQDPFADLGKRSCDPTPPSEI